MNNPAVPAVDDVTGWTAWGKDYLKGTDPFQAVLPELELSADDARLDRALKHAVVSLCYKPLLFRRGCGAESRELVDVFGQVRHSLTFLKAQLLSRGRIDYVDPGTKTAVVHDGHVVPTVVDNFSGLGSWGEDDLVFMNREAATPLGIEGGGNVVLIGTVYDDLEADGNFVRKYVWPVDVVTVVKGGAVGFTAVVATEESPDNQPGLWVRYRGAMLIDPRCSPVSVPNAACYQVGCAFLPIIQKPENVFIYKVKSVSELIGRDYVA